MSKANPFSDDAYCRVVESWNCIQTPFYIHAETKTKGWTFKSTCINLVKFYVTDDSYCSLVNSPLFSFIIKISELFAWSFKKRCTILETINLPAFELFYPIFFFKYLTWLALQSFTHQCSFLNFGLINTYWKDVCKFSIESAD